MGRIGLAALAVAAAGAAAAQDFRGAELSAEILGYTDDLGVGETNYRASVEMGVFGPLAVQADLSFNASRTVDLDSRTLTVHALYDAFAMASVAGFYSRDRITAGGVDGDVDVYGLEAGSSWGMAGGEAFVAQASGGDFDGTLLGFEGAYDIASAFSLTAQGAMLRSDEANLGRLAVGAEYRMGAGPALYAQVGRLGAESAGTSDGETFVTLGARIGLGPSGGTTFGSRSLFDVVSGF